MYTMKDLRDKYYAMTSEECLKLYMKHEDYMCVMQDIPNFDESPEEEETHDHLDVLWVAMDEPERNAVQLHHMHDMWLEGVETRIGIDGYD